MDVRDRQQAGWYSKRIGQVFENELEARMSVAHHLGVLIKQHPEVKFLDKGRAKVVDVGYPDYILLHPKPAHLVFDTKTTANANKLSLNKKVKGNRSFKQFEKMVYTYQDAHAIAFYLVEWRTHAVVEVFLVTDLKQWPLTVTYEAGELRASTHNPFWFDEIVTGLVTPETLNNNP